MSAIAAAQAFVDRFNAEYEAKHEAFERQFWGKEKKTRTETTVFVNVSLYHYLL